MTERGSLPDSWWTNDPVHFNATSPTGAPGSALPCQQLQLDLQGFAPAEAPHDWQPTPPARLPQPTPDRDRPTPTLREQAERIQHLEKALDQSLASLEDLRRQLIDQQFLEAQLASTEEISNIQQQAITQLKWQLQQQQQTLATQQQLNQSQSQLLQDFLTLLETPTDNHPLQPEPLNAQPSRARHLAQALQARQAEIEQLETELERAHEALQIQQAQIDLLQQAHTVRQSLNESPLDGELFKAQSKIQDLETHLSRQMTNQAMLQHTCQELEQTRDRYQTRITELEQQTAEMQEQILKQAQQASEYETAIQHWKDRYTQNQTCVNRLRDLLAESLTEPSPEITEVLAQLQSITNLTETEAATLPVSKGIKKDVPDFLMRRQRYRVRH